MRPTRLKVGMGDMPGTGIVLSLLCSRPRWRQDEHATCTWVQNWRYRRLRWRRATLAEVGICGTRETLGDGLGVPTVSIVRAVAAVAS